MRILLKSLRICDPRSTHNGKTRDILIENGIITEIKAEIKAGDAQVISSKNFQVSPGWIDLRANFKDPGEEHKEGLINGLDAAARGGFTKVVVLPSTLPPIDSKQSVEYLLHRSAGHVVEVLPAGTISEGMKGKNLSEMFDMQQAGAVLFTDDQHPVDRAELMHRALEYARNFSGLIMTIPFDTSFAPGGQMHEGVENLKLGMKGIPMITETLRLQRDLSILEYTGGRMHVSLLSCAESVELIKKAKKDGLDVSADICAHQLCFNDRALSGFDTNYKVQPPFRSDEHRKALIKGIKDGIISALCSDHHPQDTESKILEFAHAQSGISSIETTFSSALQSLEDSIGLDAIISLLSYGPAEILNLDIPGVNVGKNADLTLFDPSHVWTVNRENLVSRSYYTPYLNKEIKGRAMGIIRDDQMLLFN
jgi:dihydroorotase